MNFGLKLWSTNHDTLPQAEQLIKDDVFQYIELTPIPGTKIGTFLSYDLPYTIHITTERHGMNIADREKKDYNFEIINNCIEWADQLKAEYLVLHPGFGSLASSIRFLECIDDNRILIENMPKVGLFDEVMVGYSPEQISELIGLKFGFCLDINHAIKASISLELDYKDYIRRFMDLNPRYFHLSDGNLNNDKDEHLGIGQGKYDFGFLMQCISPIPSKYITLETPRNKLESFDEDLVNLTKIKTYIE